MLEEQFYIRLILNVVVGIMFAYALYRMAKHNNQETTPVPHKAMHVFGWIFIGLSILCLGVCIFYLTVVDFPQQLIGPFIEPIVRPSSAEFYWGYPTSIQNSTLTMALATFDCLGFGAYFLYFKSSNSKWWKKILKLFVVLLLYAFMSSATNFHYFDFPEFIAPILFVILWLVIVNRKGKPIQNQKTRKELVKEVRSNFLTKTHLDKSIHGDKEMKSDNIQVTPDEKPSIAYNNKETDNKYSIEEDKSASSIHIMRFCRHCGKDIEVNSAYCKYCGGAQCENERSSETPMKSIHETKLQLLRESLGKLLTKKRTKSDKPFPFTKLYKVVSILIAVISLIAVIIYAWLFKYKEYLHHYHDTLFICTCINIPLLLITWYLCHKQEQIYNKWKSFIIFIILFLSSITTIILVVNIDIILSDFQSVKESYLHHQNLYSNNPEVLNEELNIRFERGHLMEDEYEYYKRIENTKSKRIKIDFYCYTLFYNRLDKDSECFMIIEKESQKNNGVAQGILGDYYFSKSLGQIHDSKNESGYISNSSIYQEALENLERAFYWWKKASENDDAIGLYRMGSCYAYDIVIDGIPKDLNMAFQYWTKSSEKGYGMAYKRLGDLFGTWNYLDGVYVDISNGSRKGIDKLGSDENPSFSKPYPLPTEWEHDISIARSYWEKAAECGGCAASEAKKCLEKVYPEEKSVRNQRFSSGE